jgi:8-oxo-dGTP pyrophosphatase MutT (NUDIX family)
MHLRPRAEVIVFKDMKVLADLTGGHVVFPGGGIEMHETPIEAAQRECQEEAGRRVINLTPAHKGTLQFWHKDFAKGNRWAKDFIGGYSHWFTGSSSEEPVAKKHKDYQPGFDYHPVKVVLDKLKHELGGDWAEEVQARINILQAHLCAHNERKAAYQSLIPSESPFPALNALRR